MSKRERVKGMVAEREVCDLINRYTSYSVSRSPFSGALSWLKGDIRGFPGFHLEVKRQERLCMDAWSEQAERQAEKGDIAAVVYRRSRQPWRISMPLVDFLKLVNEIDEMHDYEAGA